MPVCSWKISYHPTSSSALYQATSTTRSPDGDNDIQYSYWYHHFNLSTFQQWYLFWDKILVLEANECLNCMLMDLPWLASQSPATLMEWRKNKSMVLWKRLQVFCDFFFFSIYTFYNANQWLFFTNFVLIWLNCKTYLEISNHSGYTTITFVLELLLFTSRQNGVRMGHPNIRRSQTWYLSKLLPDRIFWGQKCTQKCINRNYGKFAIKQREFTQYV